MKFLLKGLTIYSAGNLISKLSQALLEFILAYLLGPVQYGIFTLSFVTCKLTEKVSHLGVPQTILKFLPDLFKKKQYSEINNILQKLLVLTTSLSLFIVAGVIIFRNYIANVIFGEPDLALILSLMILGVPLFLISKLIAYLLRSIQKIELDVLIKDVVRNISLFSLIMISYFFFPTALGASLGYLLASLITFLLALILLIRNIPSDLINELKTLAISKNKKIKTFDIYSFSLITWLLTMGAILLNKVDRFMLGYFKSAEIVGIYNIASLIGVQVAFFLNSLNQVFSSTISKLYNNKKIDQLNTQFKTIARWSVIFSLPFPILFWGWGRSLLALPGEEYTQGFPVLIILSIAYFISASVGSVGYLLTLTKHHKLELINSFSLNLLNIILNITLIPLIGFVGAAVATAISIITINLLRLCEVKFCLKLWPYTFYFLKPLISGIILFWGVYFFKHAWHWFLGIPAFYLLYLLMIYLLGLHPNDKQTLKKALTQIVDYP